jgi:hypothetical protein
MPGRHAPSTLLLALMGLLVATPALAVTLTTTSTSMVAGRADPRDGNLHTVMPFLEMVSLRAYDFNSRSIANAEVVLSAWGSLVGGEPRDGKTGRGDLDLAYGEGSLFKYRLFVRVGRQFVVPGAASMLHLDGADASLKLIRNVGISGFAGSPVSPRFGGYDHGDFATGVRAFYRPSVETEVGLSYVFMYGHETILRRDLGFDARVKLLPQLSLQSYVRYAVTEQRMVDGNLALHGQILPNLEVGVGARRTAPDLFIPRYSIFSVFSQETRDEWGGFAYYRPVRWLDVNASFYQFNNETGLGYNATGRVTGDVGARGTRRFGVEGRRLSIPSDGFQAQRGGYLMGRVFGVQRFSTKLSAMLDASYFHFDNALNGYPRSISASGSIGWDFLPSWRAVVTGVISETPFASHQIETLAKVVYNGRYVSTRKVD